MFSIRTKKGQEEMVGFGMIIVIVSIILLFLLFLFLRSTQTTSDNPEAQSFLGAALQYTTECTDSRSTNESLQSLIIDCSNGQDKEGLVCSSGQKSCDLLNSTLSQLLSSSWQIGQNYPSKGYRLSIKKESGDFVFSTQRGNQTRTIQGSSPISIPTSSGTLEVSFDVFY